VCFPDLLRAFFCRSSCWAQSAIGSLEDRLKKTGKYRAPLSIQAAVDCVKSSESSGCEGGTPMDVLEYFKQHPIPLESEYPYTGKVGTCTQSTYGQVLSNGWAQVGTQCTSGICAGASNNEITMLRALTAPSAVPLIAYVDASSWQDYDGDLFPSSKCSPNADIGNHVIQIVSGAQQSVRVFVLSPVRSEARGTHSSRLCSDVLPDRLRVGAPARIDGSRHSR
jgi:hypothetical protein